MFVVGVILCVSLSLTDVGVGFNRPGWLTRYDAEWPHTHAYIPNVLAGFTGFLIGAPVAAVVLAAFTIQREQEAAIKQANVLSQFAWYTFRDSAYKFCSFQRIYALQEWASGVEQAHNEAFTAIDDCIQSVRTPGGRLRDFLDQTEAIARTARPFGLLVRKVADAVGDSYAARDEWSTITGAWNILDQYVRVQRLELDLEWFDPVVDSSIRTWMSRPINPLQQLIDLHGFSFDNVSSSNTMVDAAARAAVHLDHPLEFARTSDGFGDRRVDGYELRRTDAVQFLLDLRKLISIVEDQNWPECSTKPTSQKPQKFQRAVKFDAATRIRPTWCDPT
jgi:hypothetical protein